MSIRFIGNSFDLAAAANGFQNSLIRYVICLMDNIPLKDVIPLVT